MARYILTGNYSQQSIKGMITNPSDREAATRPLVEAAGGTFLSFYATLGESDFQLTVETDDLEGLVAALMVAGASGGVSNLKTVQAFTAAELLAMQTRAGGLAGAFTPAG
ncbi:MAG: GYD domain-containing protein [Silicimonas sp.]|nr:GYD domain-containing protein [Silicimonas sp.]